MARLETAGFELNSIADGIEFHSTYGTPEIVTTPKRSGNYAGKILIDNDSKYFQFLVAPQDNDGPYYARFYLYVAQRPTGRHTIFNIQQIEDPYTQLIMIDMDESGSIILSDLDGDIGAKSIPLELNTWYRIEAGMDKQDTAGNHIVTGKIDGEIFATSNTRNLAYSVGAVTFGANLTGWTLSTELYFDDIAVNNGEGENENSFPGEGSVLIMRPIESTSNVNTGLTRGGADSGSDVTQINEETPDDATKYLTTGASETYADFKVTNPYDLGLKNSDTVKLLEVNARGRGADNTYFNTRLMSGIGTIPKKQNIYMQDNEWRTDGVDKFTVVGFNTPTEYTLSSVYNVQKLTTNGQDIYGLCYRYLSSYHDIALIRYINGAWDFNIIALSNNQKISSGFYVVQKELVGNVILCMRTVYDAPPYAEFLAINTITHAVTYSPIELNLATNNNNFSINKMPDGTIVAFYKPYNLQLRGKKSVDNGTTWTNLAGGAGYTDIKTSGVSKCSVSYYGNDIYVFYTDASNNVSHKKLTYSAGNWSVGSEITIDTTDDSVDEMISYIDDNGKIWVCVNTLTYSVYGGSTYLYYSETGASWEVSLSVDETMSVDYLEPSLIYFYDVLYLFVTFLNETETYMSTRRVYKFVEGTWVLAVEVNDNVSLDRNDFVLLVNNTLWFKANDENEGTKYMVQFADIDYLKDKHLVAYKQPNIDRDWDIDALNSVQIGLESV